MSKSKKNVVDPTDIIEQFGADTARWFMMSDSPPERDLEWTESGIEGAWRYLKRLWLLVTESLTAPKGAPAPEALDDAAVAVLRTVHQTIAAVTEGLERFRFNRAVAHVRELTNKLADYKSEGPVADYVRHFALETVVQMIGPMMPHIAEELWHTLGNKSLLIDTPWPLADPAFLVEETVTIAMQIKGKLRGTLEMPRDADKTDVEERALALDAVQRVIKGRPPQRIIVVPNKIVNVVV